MKGLTGTCCYAKGRGSNRVWGVHGFLTRVHLVVKEGFSGGAAFQGPKALSLSNSPDFPLYPAQIPWSGTVSIPLQTLSLMPLTLPPSTALHTCTQDTEDQCRENPHSLPPGFTVDFR